MRAGAGPPSGDPDRSRWCGQDPPGRPGRGRADRRVSPTGCGWSSWLQSVTLRAGRCGGHGVGCHSAGGIDDDGRPRSRPWRGDGCCWCWTTASISSTPPPILSRQLLTHTTTVKVIATSREGLRVGAEQLWSVPSLDVRQGGVGGGGVVRGTCRGGQSWFRVGRRFRGVSGDGDLPAVSMGSRWRSSWRRRGWW